MLHTEGDDYGCQFQLQDRDFNTQNTICIINQDTESAAIYNNALSLSKLLHMTPLITILEFLPGQTFQTQAVNTLLPGGWPWSRHGPPTGKHLIQGYKKLPKPSFAFEAEKV